MTILDEIQKFLMSFSTPKQQFRQAEPARNLNLNQVVNDHLPADKRDGDIIGY